MKSIQFKKHLCHHRVVLFFNLEELFYLILEIKMDTNSLFCKSQFFLGIFSFVIYENYKINFIKYYDTSKIYKITQNIINYFT